MPIQKGDEKGAGPSRQLLRSGVTLHSHMATVQALTLRIPVSEPALELAVAIAA